MTFSDTEMKELDRGTAYNTHNITSLTCTPQAYIRHLADGRSLHGRRVQTHTHTHTHNGYLDLTKTKEKQLLQISLI